MDFYRNPNAATPGLIVRDVGLLLLRVGSALLLGFYSAWQQSLAGWNFFWKKESWNLLDFLTSHSIPIPQVISVVVVLILVLGSLGLFFGVLARLSAGLLLACAIGGVLLNFLHPEAERYWLYAVNYFVLLLCGPGCFSLAYLLNRR